MFKSDHHYFPLFFTNAFLEKRGVGWEESVKEREREGGEGEILFIGKRQEITCKGVRENV